jgi:transcription initiation factor TFIIE subunit alpha
MNKLKKELLSEKNTIKFLEQIAGPSAINIVKTFNNDGLSPEEISKKLNEKITVVRSTLNSLHFRGIACYKKQRDENNLYQFVWEIKYKKIVDVLLIQEMKKYKKIEYQLTQNESHDYFQCSKKCNVEFAFEVAAAYNFKCPNCSSDLKMINSKTKLNKLKKEKKEIETNIEKLENILRKINDNTKGFICE